MAFMTKMEAINLAIYIWEECLKRAKLAAYYDDNKSLHYSLGYKHAVAEELKVKYGHFYIFNMLEDVNCPFCVYVEQFDELNLEDDCVLCPAYNMWGLEKHCNSFGSPYKLLEGYSCLDDDVLIAILEEMVAIMYDAKNKHMQQLQRLHDA